MASEWMTAKETAAYLRISTNALYIGICRRKSWAPSAYRFGKYLRFKRAEVEAAIKPVEH